MLWCLWRILAGTSPSELSIWYSCQWLQDTEFDIDSRVNAVETMYAAFPAIMYIDPNLGKPLLDPLFRLQASPNYSVQYAAGDLGMSYKGDNTESYTTFQDQAILMSLPACQSTSTALNVCGPPRIAILSLNSVWCRDREYADHDLCSRPSKRRWKPHTQICMPYKLIISMKSQPITAVSIANFLG